MLPDDIWIGDTLRGYFTYELGAVDGDPNPARGFYQYGTPPNTMVVYANGGWVFRSDETNVSIQFTVKDSLVSQGVASDGYWFRSWNNTGSATGRVLPMGFVQFELADNSLTALSDDSLPIEPPNLSAWPDEKLLFITGDQLVWVIFAEIETTSGVLPTGVPGAPRTPVGWLGPNIPNPFNPNTSLPFRIERFSHVTLAVYDARGGSVRTLLDKHLDAGAYSIQWDGRDERGAVLPSGVYFCRLAVDGVSSTRKVTLLK